MKNKVILVVLIFSMVFVNLISVNAQEEIRIYLNEKQIQFDVQPIIVKDRVMVPFRKIFEEIGAVKLDWSETYQSILAVACYNRIDLQINNKVASFYGKDVELDVPPMIVNDRTLVPLRFVMQSVSASVDWNEETQTVNISLPTTSGIEKENLKYYESYPDVISLDSTGCNTYETKEDIDGEILYQYNFGDYENLNSDDIQNITKVLSKYELLLKENGYRWIDVPTTTRWFTNDKYYVGVFYFDIWYPSITISQDGSLFNR